MQSLRFATALRMAACGSNISMASAKSAASALAGAIFMRFESTGDRKPRFQGKRHEQRGKFDNRQGRRSPSTTDKSFSLDKMIDDLPSDDEPVSAIGDVTADAELAAPLGRTRFPGDRAGAVLIDAVIDNSGVVVAADDKDVPVDDSAPVTAEDRRKALKNFLYYRRNLRTTYDSEDFEDYTMAAARNAGSDVEDEDIDSIVRADEYAPGEDPLHQTPLPFDVRQVRFTTFMTLDAPPNTKRMDRRASLHCHVAKLGLEPAVAKYVRAIAGPHYNPRTDLLKISSDSHADAASNRRKVLEQLVMLVEQSSGLSKKFGDFSKQTRFPRYAY